ncbi:AAA domain-containing protein [Citricoccus sp. NR2]|uniref:AAA domain-containing protein n=1 Tax=Citricoccus sp. NR2 TaxID=3004095 RepID=UPI0022DD0E04|nr:AAA domain-containing protein [Citricoccus sp. NR2]WBL17803.1 AAA family ATPase [Citricoccus sp. NR2]
MSHSDDRTPQADSTEPVEDAPAAAQTDVTDATSAEPDTGGEVTAGAPLPEDLEADAAAESDTAESAEAESESEVDSEPEPAAEEEPSAPQPNEPRFSFDEWLTGLRTSTSSDTMLRFGPTANNSIDVTHAHPSGLTQFVTGRRTRLSTLLRDQSGLDQAYVAARQISAKMEELSADRGIDVGYAAAGLATWRVSENGHSVQMSAPVMLARISLTQRSGRDDYEVQITERARLNPALVRFFATTYGITLDPAEFERAAYVTAKFEPQPALELLRAHNSSIRGLVVEHRLVLSTFADLTDSASATSQLISTDHPVINALYRDGAEADVDVTELDDAALTPIDERDPAEELLVLDLDPSQQTAVDHILAGRSLVVSAPPGTGETQTAVAAAAGLAAEGKRVLIVAERTATLDDVRRRLERLDLASLALNVSSSTTPAHLREQLIHALLRGERATEPAVKRVQATVQERRHRLADHSASLHQVRTRWNCSPFEAMRELAQLTALDPAPATTVRLKRSVLDATVNREAVAEQLHRAAELGAFSRQAVESPWYGARLRNVQEAEEAYTLAEQVAKALPVVRVKIQQAAAQSQLRTGDTVTSWSEQIELLQHVRGSLDHFTPDIFDRPVTDLIAATASSSWRREHGVEMSAMTRSRLRRVAKEYVRPGMHVDDLHTALVKVQSQLTVWRQWATSQRHPVIPSGLESLAEEGRALAENLERLQQVLATPEADTQRLENLPISELAVLLDRLVADQDTLQTLPERTLVLDQLREQGLAELLADFQDREIPATQVRAELDVSWWQSALEAMISGDDHLAMMDGAELRRIDAEFRLADAAHLAAGPSRLRHLLATRFEAATGSHPEAADALRNLLKGGAPEISELAEIDAAVLQPLVPIWTTSPLALAEMPADLRFDTVLLLDAETLAVASALGPIARATQTVAFGDAVSGRPQPFQVAVDSASTRRTPTDAESTHAALSRVLPQGPLRYQHRGVSQRLTRLLGRQLYGELDRLPSAEEFTGLGEPAVVVEHVPQGAVSWRDDGMESTTAEVNRTVDLVFEHLKNHPTTSLAVITATATHARRVAEAIRMNLPDNKWAMPYFAADSGNGGEPFVVAPMERAHGLVRDAIIFTLGYGRGAQESVVHHFGPLSEQHSHQYYATALTRARSSLRILTCIHPADLDPKRLQGASYHLREVLEMFLHDADEPTRTEAGAGTDASASDPLIHDIAQLLDQRGATAEVDGAGMIDLAAWNPRGLPQWDGAESEDYAAPVALSSDGSERGRAMSVRERSRLRPAALERLGWRHQPLWTIDVFSNPLGVTEEIAGLLGLPADDGEATR